jgi:hypothetical protein
MLVVHVPHVGIQQIDDFPSSVELDATETVVVNNKKVKRQKRREFKRSCRGALHVRPRSTLMLTEDELAWLKKRHAKLAAKLQIIKSGETKKKPATPLAHAPDDSPKVESSVGSVPTSGPSKEKTKGRSKT